MINEVEYAKQLKPVLEKVDSELFRLLKLLNRNASPDEMRSPILEFLSKFEGEYGDTESLYISGWRSNTPSSQMGFDCPEQWTYLVGTLDEYQRLDEVLRIAMYELVVYERWTRREIRHLKEAILDYLDQRAVDRQLTQTRSEWTDEICEYLRGNRSKLFRFVAFRKATYEDLDSSDAFNDPYPSLDAKKRACERLVSHVDEFMIETCKSNQICEVVHVSRESLAVKWHIAE